MNLADKVELAWGVRPTYDMDKEALIGAGAVRHAARYARKKALKRNPKKALGSRRQSLRGAASRHKAFGVGGSSGGSSSGGGKY